MSGFIEVLGISALQNETINRNRQDYIHISAEENKSLEFGTFGAGMEDNVKTFNIIEELGESHDYEEFKKQFKWITNI